MGARSQAVRHGAGSLAESLQQLVESSQTQVRQRRKLEMARDSDTSKL